MQRVARPDPVIHRVWIMRRLAAVRNRKGFSPPAGGWSPLTRPSRGTAAGDAPGGCEKPRTHPDEPYGCCCAPTFTVRLFDVGVVSFPSLSCHVAVMEFVCEPPQKYASNVHSYGVEPTGCPPCGNTQVVFFTSPCTVVMSPNPLSVNAVKSSVSDARVIVLDLDLVANERATKAVERLGDDSGRRDVRHLHGRARGALNSVGCWIRVVPIEGDRVRRRRGRRRARHAVRREVGSRQRPRNNILRRST